MTLTAWLLQPGAPAATGDPVGMAHLSIAPMLPGDNAITITLTDLDGGPLTLADSSTLSLTTQPLVPAVSPVIDDLGPASGEPATWTVDTMPLPDQGWYALELSLQDGSKKVAVGTLYVLLPDPSVYGADALDLPASDPDAEALYEHALASYGAWESARWRESLGSGTDVLVVTDYAVADPGTGAAAMTTASRYAGSFRDRPDGTMPAPPRLDFGRRIAIGDRTWTMQDDGTWAEAPSPGTSGFAERADIYTGATSVLPGGSETIAGIETRIVTFYLPPKGGQAEAWFAWWIDPETGNPLRMVMVAEMHFMLWNFHGIDEPLTTEPPPASEIATPTG